MKYTLKDGFMLRNVGDSFYIVPVGKRSKTHRVMITINQSSAFIFDKLKENKTLEEIEVDYFNEYEIPGNTDEEKLAKAKLDVSNCIHELIKAGIIENEQ